MTDDFIPKSPLKTAAKRRWSGVWGGNPIVTPRNPKIAKRFKRNVNQGAKRPLIPLTLLQTAAKRRRESEGLIPSGRFGRQPKVTPRNPKIAKRFKRSVNQGAKRPLILLTLLQTAAKRRWSLEMISPSGSWGLKSRTRCAGFSMTEIGNRKERLRVREAGASAAGRGQRPYASFPDRQPCRPPTFPNRTKPCVNRPSGFASLPDFFFLNRFAIGERWGISSPKPPAWGLVPRPLLRFALMARFFENKHKNPPAASS